MFVKFILPSLIEAKSPLFRPIKYSLFPPLGLATLAAFLDPEDRVEIVDQHVETLRCDDEQDLVGIEVYITNAKRAYAIADHYRAKGVTVLLGGLHVTSLPEEAAAHADVLFLGPAEASFPAFLKDYRQGSWQKRYVSAERTLQGLPRPRRDLIRRERYLVPNSIVVSRGCPHHCDFCYKDAFYQGGSSFYVQAVEDALAEIDSLPGRHLYFLDDHLLGHKRFAHALFSGMRGMNRVFQGAATVQSILSSPLIEEAANAGLRSLFVGFETLNPENLSSSNKQHNIGQDYEAAIERLHDLGVMINASFVFGLDSDTPEVFKRTVDWAVRMGVTTSTFHIATPYPGTGYYRRLEQEGRILTRNWDLYDTRHVVFQTKGMDATTLEAGYHQAYRDFYAWSNIWKASMGHDSTKHRLKHFAYTAGWKKMEPLWNIAVQLKKLNLMTPLLEGVLSRVNPESVNVTCRGEEGVPSA